MGTETMDECQTCAGCGQVANDDDRTPWKYWAELPVQSAAAIFMGIVRPVACPDCGGNGRLTDPRASSGAEGEG